FRAFPHLVSRFLLLLLYGTVGLFLYTNFFEIFFRPFLAFPPSIGEAGNLFYAQKRKKRNVTKMLQKALDKFYELR
ncbi:MAG: hypothetical protein U0L92_02645, partial [Clostridia bacterium]|nr:hypothetical protein [Clostridia bacterium]